MSNNFPGRFILAADITLTSPMHISAIEKGRYIFDGGRSRIVRYDAGPSSPGLQCTLSKSQRIMVDSVAQAESNGDQPGQFGSDIPVIPASTIGGKLRNLAASLIFDSLIARGLTLSTNAYNMMTTGSATTGINASDATPQLLSFARREPFLANVGGTSFMLSSSSVISTGWPLVQATREMLMSPELLPAETLPDLKWMGQMCSAVTLVRKDNVREMRSPQLQQVVKLDDLMAYVQEKGEQAISAKASKAKQKEAKAAGEYIEADKKTDLRTIGAFEAVNPGMSFALRVRVDAATPAQLGLMVLAMQRLLQQGQIGGKLARGCGQFVCHESRLLEVDPATNRVKDANGQALFCSRNEGYEIAGLYDDLPTFLVQSVMAARDYLQEVNPFVMEAFASADGAMLKTLYSAEA